ncbi:hypothetical protein Pta02_62410 [Planobispora takensis]|uniref:Uncharacterized protein n=1 Tax=Planobispora takensis TaxID=1367882 RepID=A0A8J3T4T8_9ACTN|nr:hypothetical protein Pta02_62410 [Planobispora takensis]
MWTLRSLCEVSRTGWASRRRWSRAVSPLDDCTGVSPHVSTAQRDHVRLEWRTPYPALERARPVAWTCVCRSVIYELRVGAGQGFIRRTVQLDGGHQVLESRSWLQREAWAVWADLLAGRVR